MFQTVRGMQDFMPERMVYKQYIEDVIRDTYELYGFKPLETPALEEFSLLSKKGTGGEAIKKEIYYFKDQGDRELGMRFDLTVPLARVVASNPQLTKPFKRYQIGRVWRYDRPQAGRYREFTQADIDIVGSSSLMCEVECLMAGSDILEKLGLDFVIKVNHKGLLEDVAKASGLTKVEDMKEAFRIIDKLDKVGWEGVQKEYGEKKLDGNFLEIIKENDLESIKELVKNSKNLQELEEFLNLIIKTKLQKNVKVDLTLARGLEYYTGMVFEFLAGGTNSCCGGGRYDKLIESFGGQPTPAIGISFGIERLMNLTQEKIKLESKTKLFVIPIGNTQKQVLEIVEKIRDLKIATEMDIMNRNISKNMSYADKQQIPYTLILGETELSNKEAKVKNMKNGQETKLNLEKLAELKEILK